MGYMVVRGDEMKRVFVDEIAVLVIENPAVSFTGCLMETLVEKKGSHGYDVLMIESYARPMLKNECRVIIDNDLCEI